MEKNWPENNQCGGAPDWVEASMITNSQTENPITSRSVAAGAKYAAVLDML